MRRGSTRTGAIALAWLISINIGAGVRAADTVAQATITGPVSGGTPGRPFGGLDDAALAASRFTEAEYFFSGSATAYEKVIRDYTTSDILPEAWYKVGISYDRLGQADKAREAFEFVVKTYPDSNAATLAKQELARQEPAQPARRN